MSMKKSIFLQLCYYGAKREFPQEKNHKSFSARNNAVVWFPKRKNFD